MSNNAGHAKQVPSSSTTRGLECHRNWTCKNQQFRAQGARCEINLSDQGLHEMLTNFTKSVKKDKNRKSVAPGEIPNEIWRIIMEPNWHAPGYTPPTGIGHSLEYGDTTKISQQIRKLFGMLKHKSTLPMHAMLNQMVTLPKKVAVELKGKKLLDTKRPMHMYSPFSQAIARTIESSTKRKPPRGNAYGAVRNKRREEAILLQSVNRE